jgi:hypothetical protein
LFTTQKHFRNIYYTLEVIEHYVQVKLAHLKNYCAAQNLVFVGLPPNSAVSPALAATFDHFRRWRFVLSNFKDLLRGLTIFFVGKKPDWSKIALFSLEVITSAQSNASEFARKVQPKSLRKNYR